LLAARRIAIAPKHDSAQYDFMVQVSLIRLVKIKASFGSDIQHDVCMKILREFLEAWKMNVESAHKKNRVTIEYGRERKPN
jgi:hypothetical protein